MIVFNGYSYSGSVVSSDANELKVMIMTNEQISDVCIKLNNVKLVKDVQQNDQETEYVVTTANTVSKVAANMYLITFLTKPTVMQEMSDAIDTLLVMALER